MTRSRLGATMRWTDEQYQEYLGKPKKKSKYNAKKTVVDGITFDSKKEAEYYIGLKALVRAGEIKGFARQCKFVVTEGDEETKATEYLADFIVIHNDDKAEIIDTKGVQTAVFKLKMKCFREKYPNLRVKLK